MQYDRTDYETEHLDKVPLYNVGDKVLIRSDIEDWEKDYTPHLTEDMEEYTGREVTIAYNIGGPTMYKIVEDGETWKWHHNWFEPLMAEDENEEEPDKMTELLKEMDARSAKELGNILGW